MTHATGPQQNVFEQSSTTAQCGESIRHFYIYCKPKLSLSVLFHYLRYRSIKFPSAFFSFYHREFGNQFAALLAGGLVSVICFVIFEASDKTVTRSFLFLSANTPWVYALAEALSVHASVTTVRFYDWGNFRRLNPQWPEETSPVRRVTVSLPPGYAGRLGMFFCPILQAVISRERARLRRTTGTEPIVVCPYPYLAPWVRGVPDRNLVYYNLDNYLLYDLSRSERTALLEGELIRRAAVSLCLSVHQVGALRSRHEHHADRIRHFPLGVVEEFLNPDPSAAPIQRTVGYVGNLTSRVDWSLVERVATLLPEATFHIVGKLDDFDSTSKGAGWKAARGRVLGLANVVYEGAVPQAKVREHYWRYAVNWMPYAPDHPFNIASCPTKIMDALASGRPFVSTIIPEVQLYPDRIAIADGAEMAAMMIQKAFGSPPAPAEQVSFARNQNWARRAEMFLSFIDEITISEALAQS